MNQLVFLTFICKLTGVALLLQTTELILLRELVSDQGVWRWEVLKDDFSFFPRFLRTFFGIVYCEQGFLSLIVLQFSVSGFLLFFSSPVLPVLLFWTALLISVRFRGTFNGGSDYMTLVLLSALSAAVFFRESRVLLTACFWYIAIQTCFSYFISGWVKLRNRHWRRAEALLPFLIFSNYETPVLMQGLLKHKSISMLVSWAVILFECSFPVALINHRFCIAYIALAIVFHLANFYIFGLNRFLFVWAATYPALYFCSGRLA